MYQPKNLQKERCRERPVLEGTQQQQQQQCRSGLFLNPETRAENKSTAQDWQGEGVYTPLAGEFTPVPEKRRSIWGAHVNFITHLQLISQLNTTTKHGLLVSKSPRLFRTPPPPSARALLILGSVCRAGRTAKQAPRRTPKAPLRGETLS